MVLSVDYDRELARLLWFYPQHKHEDVSVDVVRNALIQRCPGCGRVAKSTVSCGVTRFRVSPAPGEPFHHESWHIDCYNNDQKDRQFPVTVSEF